MQYRVLFDPVHQQQPEQSEKRDHRLQRDKEANEYEIANDVDILDADLVLWLLCDIVQLVLRQDHLVD